MSDLLTHDDYRALAAQITFPTNAFIDGTFQKAKSGKTFETVNPATGEVLAKIAACDSSDVDYAVERAQKAFDDGVWSNLAPSERKDIIIKWCKLMQRHRHELAVLESLESGKPISECQQTDVPETIHAIKWHAEAADKLYDQMSPTNDDAISMIVREPLGVVGCVLPWNYPLMMAAWKLGPALATGNSVIVKPAEQTNMTLLRIAELSVEAGIPAGVLNVLTGMGPDVGEPMGRHPNIEALSFTGSTEVGRLFLKFSAESNLKKVILECGGKNPAVVLSDAEDLNNVARHVVYSAVWNMGQNCTANSRLIVHKDVKDELMKHIDQQIRNWKTGDPLDPSNQLGAIVSQEQFDKIMGYIEIAKKDGGKIIHGGKAIELNGGLFIEPTIVDNVTRDMTIAQEEIFGPVMAVMTVGSDAEALELANDTCYGLQASLYTGSLKKAHRFSRALKAGTVSVNSYSEGDISTPFGGYKQSGFGGRDNSLMAHDQYTEVKTIWINTSDESIDDDV
ncbi:aldehyde dehydrogenase [Kiloniella sp. b19]|uniref:aldehyde dehydrogenase n=1 Tax=Kiloniella sp. GXU_MW_B19 TaxID=3141326 RepID=UPI0031D7C0FB